MVLRIGEQVIYKISVLFYKKTLHTHSYNTIYMKHYQMILPFKRHKSIMLLIQRKSIHNNEIGQEAIHLNINMR